MWSKDSLSLVVLRHDWCSARSIQVATYGLVPSIRCLPLLLKFGVNLPPMFSELSIVDPFSLPSPDKLARFFSGFSDDLCIFEREDFLAIGGLLVSKFCYIVNTYFLKQY